MTMFYSCLILFGWFSVESISNLSTIYKYLRNLEDYIYIYYTYVVYNICLHKVFSRILKICGELAAATPTFA